MTFFGTKTKKIAYNENENSFSAENEKTESDQIAHFRRRKRKRISVGFWFDGLTWLTLTLQILQQK